MYFLNQDLSEYGHIFEYSTLIQPPPTNGGIKVLDGMADLLIYHNTEGLVLYKCLQNRAIVGREKYGMWLETNNGRNSLVDAFQEALDLIMYLKQYDMEQTIDIYLTSFDIKNDFNYENKNTINELIKYSVDAAIIIAKLLHDEYLKRNELKQTDNKNKTEKKLLTLEYYNWEDTYLYMREKYGIDVYENHYIKIPLSKGSSVFIDYIQSYWDFLAEHALDDITSGGVAYIDWAITLSLAEENWQKEITEKFIIEYGEGSIAYMLPK